MNSAQIEANYSPEERALVAEVRDFFDSSSQSKKPHTDNWRRWNDLHRGYVNTRNDYASARSENDRDEVIRGAQREFGADLHIPYVFAVIETIVPRALMNNPRMKVKPRADAPATANTDAVKALFEERQAEINYALILHPTVRQGFKFGLGVQKTFWERDVRMRRQVRTGLFGRQIVQETPVVLSEGPTAEHVHLPDFFWAPYAKDMKTCDKALHRTWRPISYVKKMMESGRWIAYDLEAVDGLGGTQPDPNEDWTRDMLQQSGVSISSGKNKLHEVWEFHDGERVITILDRCLIVQNDVTPFFHRELPFQIFRPTWNENEFVGMGEIQPIEHLQYELNTLRSQRRDNATLVLQKAFIYAEGMVDPADLVIGPGKGIPVYGDPAQVIQPLNFGPLDGSGYQEESAIKADMEFAVGVSESLAGSGASEETATGTQLVQAAANVRVEMKAKLMQAEVLTPGAAQWLEGYRQHMLTDKQVMVETPTGYQPQTVTTEDLWAVQAMVIEDRSTEPENKPQKINDALAVFNQAVGNPAVDQRKLLAWYFKQVGVAEAEGWILPEQMTLNPQVAEQVGHMLADELFRRGVDHDEAEDTAVDVMQAVMASVGVSNPDEAASDPSIPNPAEEAPV